MTASSLVIADSNIPITFPCYCIPYNFQNGIGDANDIWKIMISGGRENETISTVSSKLMLVHYLQTCALTTSGKQLPKWGFEQQEVSCNPNIRDPSAYWNVEDNKFDKCKCKHFVSC